MITTLMITSIVSSLPPHTCYYHTLHYLDLYDTNAPRFVNSSVPTFPYIVPLLYSSDLFSHHFRFLLHPSSLFCVFTFLKLLMTSCFPIDLIPATLFCIYLREPCTRGLFLTVSVSTDADLLYPYLYRMFPVFLVTHRIFASTVPS